MVTISSMAFFPSYDFLTVCSVIPISLFPSSYKLSVERVEQEVKGVIDILSVQKDNIKNMNSEILNVEQTLKITTEAIVKHIGEAGIVDRKLEETEEQVALYSKKFIN